MSVQITAEAYANFKVIEGFIESIVFSVDKGRVFVCPQQGNTYSFVMGVKAFFIHPLPENEVLNKLSVFKLTRKTGEDLGYTFVSDFNRFIAELVPNAAHNAEANLSKSVISLENTRKKYNEVIDYFRIIRVWMDEFAAFSTACEFTRFNAEFQRTGLCQPLEFTADFELPKLISREVIAHIELGHALGVVFETLPQTKTGCVSIRYRFSL